MPRYEIRTLDVWGNARNGFEVNQTFHAGHLDVARNLLEGEGWDQRLVEALIEAGHLNAAALELLEQGRLQIEDYDGSHISVDEFVEGEEIFAAPGEGDITTADHRHWYQYDRLYFTGDEEELRTKMERDGFMPDVWLISDHGNAVLLGNDVSEEVRYEDWSPLLQLVLEVPPENSRPQPFWTRTLSDNDGDKERLVLAVDEHQQIWSCLRIDYEHPLVATGTEDWFRTWSITGLRKSMSDAPSPRGMLYVGVDSTGDRVYLYADEFEEVLVALDAYLEQGKPNSKFLRGLRGRR